jgi:hypothetical protein
VIPSHELGWLYLDPATGSLALQVTIGGLLAAMAAVRIYWAKLRSLLGRRDGAPGEDSLSHVSRRGHRQAR